MKLLFKESKYEKNNRLQITKYLELKIFFKIYLWAHTGI